MTRPERFWEQVDKTGDCWLWEGCTNKWGYGRFRDGKRVVSVHRYAYELSVEPIPVGLHIDHLCRVRTCVRPDHLEAVTNRENLQRGEGVKLNDEQVREIRRRYKQGGVTQTALGAEFGIWQTTVSQIISGELWAHV